VTPACATSFNDTIAYLHLSVTNLLFYNNILHKTPAYTVNECMHSSESWPSVEARGAEEQLRTFSIEPNIVHSRRLINVRKMDEEH